VAVAQPIAKWAGGKTRLLPELLARMPKTFGTYYEPFVGGGALFFKLAPERAVISDSNKDLIETYRAVAFDVEHVIGLLERHAVEHACLGAEYYYKVRSLWNHPCVEWSSWQRAAAFIYLNKTCFNGLWRVNRDGAFNVPAGKYKNPTICDKEGLRAASDALQGADIRWASYFLALSPIPKPGDFVYFDPPYHDTFTAYTAGAFDEKDQKTLAFLARRLVEAGVHVMVSNSDTPLIRELYAGFEISVVKCARAINSNGAGRGEVNELIIRGGSFS